MVSAAGVVASKKSVTGTGRLSVPPATVGVSQTYVNGVVAPPVPMRVQVMVSVATQPVGFAPPMGVQPDPMNLWPLMVTVPALPVLGFGTTPVPRLNARPTHWPTGLASGLPVLTALAGAASTRFQATEVDGMLMKVFRPV